MSHFLKKLQFTAQLRICAPQMNEFKSDVCMNAKHEFILGKQKTKTDSIFLRFQ